MIDLNHTYKVDKVLLEYIITWHWSQKTERIFNRYILLWWGRSFQMEHTQSSISPFDIHVMFRPDGVAGVAPISKLTQGILSTLRDGIEQLRKSKMANKYSKRLFECRDSKTALGTAVWNSNSAEISCGKWQVQFVLICLIAFFLNTAYNNLNDKMTMWRTKDYGEVLWVKCVWFISFWMPFEKIQWSKWTTEGSGGINGFSSGGV